MNRDNFTLFAICCDFLHQLRISKYHEPYALNNRAEKDEYDSKVDQMMQAMMAVMKKWGEL